MLKKRWLLVENGVLWLAAGFNIARIGALAACEESSAVWLWGIVVFAAFGAMFLKVIRKNANRIYAMSQERAPFYRFMTLRGYLVVAFMMTLGIVLRHIGGIPNVFFAFFYTGLGSALALAGVYSFFCRPAKG